MARPSAPEIDHGSSAAFSPWIAGTPFASRCPAPPPWCPRTKKRIRDIPGYTVVADLGGDLARHRPHRRHLDLARRGARRGRFSNPPLMIRRRGLGGRICHPSWTRPRNTPYFNDPKTPGNRGLKAI